METHLPTLDSIGQRYGTDKASTNHDYLCFYQRFFEALRDRAPRVLEIGVLNGASLSMWEEYFGNATVIGADINPRVAQHARRNVVIEIVDQSNIEELVRLGTRHGPFDVIIDDGSHMWEHQITTLKTLFPFLKEGGYYVVEDLQTNYGQAGKKYQGISTISCMEYLKRLADLRVAHEQIDITRVEDPFLRTYGRSMRFIAFCREACLIEKDFKSARAMLNIDSLHEPLSPGEPDAQTPPLRLLAHLGNIGDISSREIPSIRGGLKPAGGIQGFQLSANANAFGQLEYRARLQSGEWTDWCGCGVFVGTRGKSQDITGFSVRLGKELRKKWDLQLLGLFKGEEGLVAVAGGEDCISKVELAPLQAMQVVLRPKATRA